MCSIMSNCKFVPLEIRGLTSFRRKRVKTSRTSNNLSENGGVSPASYANSELVKIPNFLHLTKPHIEKHCDAIKKFCTKWPSGLRTDEDIRSHYPVTISTRSYVFASNNIRDPRSRIAELHVKLSSLSLNDQARRKLLRLVTGPGVGQKFASYDYETDLLRLESQRCPISKQNVDYLVYVLTVLTLESKKVESWESEASSRDWASFDWATSSSRKFLLNSLQATSPSNHSSEPEQIDGSTNVEKYKQALVELWSKNDVLNVNQWVERPDPPRLRHNPYPPVRNLPFEPVLGADNQPTLDAYKSATRRLYGLE